MLLVAYEYLPVGNARLVVGVAIATGFAKVVLLSHPQAVGVGLPIGVKQNWQTETVSPFDRCL